MPLRRTSPDELSELVNVVKAMSLWVQALARSSTFLTTQTPIGECTVEARCYLALHRGRRPHISQRLDLDEVRR